MSNAPKAIAIPAEVWLFCAKELLAIPFVKQLDMVQVSFRHQPIFGPTGEVASQQVEILEQIKDPYLPENREQLGSALFPFRVLSGYCHVVIELKGTLPKPVIPAPGQLTNRFATMLGRPIPIPMMWIEFNIETFEYKAMSSGPPQVTMTRTPKGGPG
jgi:hypothetical protein